MLSSPLNLLSNNISCIIHFMRIIISDMSFPIFFLILPNDTIQHLRLKWSDRLTGVVSKKSESWERRLPSNRFNEAQRRDKAMMCMQPGEAFGNRPSKDGWNLWIFWLRHSYLQVRPVVIFSQDAWWHVII